MDGYTVRSRIGVRVSYYTSTEDYVLDRRRILVQVQVVGLIDDLVRQW